MSTATSDALIARWLEQSPHHPEPAESWVLPRCVPVWSVIRQLELEYGKPEGVAEAFELPVEAVEAAVAYYRRHQSDIDARIRENRAFFGV